MRQILFRGKAVESGEWHFGMWCYEGYNADFPCIIPNYIDRDAIAFNDWEVDTETVGQYTGLIDANGNKIFEGDIVTGADFDEEDGYAKIVWDEETARFSIEAKGVSFDFDNYRGNEIEVIGNIHDNPELVRR
ncbi:MAG: hypothetical protein II881_02640 [Oscillospiraceae bacterium]|nr:hypothetical protein [Oscillospiraceae bacterium]